MAIPRAVSASYEASAQIGLLEPHAPPTLAPPARMRSTWACGRGAVRSSARAQLELVP